MSDKFKLYIITMTGILFSFSLSANEADTSNTNVLNQKPYSSNQFPGHGIVIETERHGRGTFNSYPSYQHRHRPVKHSGNRAYRYHRPTAHSRKYSSYRPSVSYYYSTPITNNAYVQIQSNPGIYTHQTQYPNYNNNSSDYASHGIKPVKRFNFYQQYRAQPYYNHHHSRNFEHKQVTQPRLQCLGPNCGK